MTFATRSIENDKLLAERAKDFYFGNTKIAKAYLGPTKVYDSKLRRAVLAQYNNDTTFYYTDNFNTFKVATNKPIDYDGANIIYDGTKFVTIAQSSTSSYQRSSYYSVDGTSWTEGGSFSDIRNGGTLLYANGKYVYADYSYNIKYAYSTDGITWSTEYQLPDTVVYGVAGNGLLVFKPYSSLDAFISTDGINWTTKTLPSGTQIYYVNGKFMFTGTKNYVPYVYITEDFNTYTSYEIPKYANGYGTIMYNNGYYIIFANWSGVYDTYLRTADFSTYTLHSYSHTSSSTSGPVSLAALNKFVAEKYGNIYTSEDGISWSDNIILAYGLYTICTTE